MDIPFSSWSLDTLLDPKEFFHQTGRILIGVSLRQKPEGWQVVITALRRGKQAEYAMLSGYHDPVSALHALLDYLYSKHASDLWRRSKFA